MKKAFLFLALLAGSGRLMAQNGSNITLQPLALLNVDTSLRSPSLKDLTKMPETSALKKLTLLPNVNVTPIDENKDNVFKNSC